MKAHHILIPVLLTVGVGACVVLNVGYAQYYERVQRAGAELAGSPDNQAQRAPTGTMTSRLTAGDTASTGGSKPTAGSPSTVRGASTAGGGAPSAPSSTASTSPDALDAAPENDAGAPADSTPTPPPGSIQLPFEGRSALFTTEAKHRLFKIAQRMKEDPSAKLKLVGHSDRTTDGAQAEGLGEKRARNVYDFLANLEISKDRLSYEATPPTTSPNKHAAPPHRVVDAIWH